jgi:hypothetical protein
MKYFLEVDAGARLTQRFALPESPVRLGSAPESELYLEGVPLALLTVEAQTDGAVVRLSPGPESSLVTNGIASKEALIAWGADAFVDGLRLSFVAEPEAKRGMNPMLLLALAAAVVWLGWQGTDARAEQRTENPDPIVLKAPQAVCLESSADAARIAAQRAERAGAARQERYFFDGSEGLKAAGSFRLAEACFGVARDAAAQARVVAQREALERGLASDQVALRLRLDTVMAQESWQDARATIRKLDQLVAPAGASEYRAGLASTLRWIDARLSER